VVIYQHHNKSMLTNGVTKAFLFNDNLAFYEKLYKDYLISDINLKMKLGIGTSFCSKDDNYNRNLGRVLSASRIKDEMLDIAYIKVCVKFVTFYVYSRENDFSFKIRFLKTFTGSPRILT
jgi:hypothetical protein